MQLEEGGHGSTNSYGVTVLPRSFQRGLRYTKVKRRPGRPKTKEQVVKLVLRLARETDWGLTRIRGELLKLRIRLSRSGVSNIRIEPAPQHGESSWDQFLKRHAKTLWACDHLGTRVLTTTGIRYAFALVFIHVHNRLLPRHPCKPRARSGAPPSRAWPPSPEFPRIVCRQRVDGVLKHYDRAA